MIHFRECARCISASCEHYRRCRYDELMSFRDSGSGPTGGDGTAPGEVPQSGRSDSEGIAQPTPPSENINGK